MFDRFTDEAKRAMNLAYESARENRTSYLDDVHILVGCCRARGSAAKVLLACGQDPIEVRARADALAAQLAGAHEDSQQLSFTPAAKRVLELVLEEATSLGHTWLGTYNLLVGVLRNGGACSEMLSRGGLKLLDARKAVIELEGTVRPR